MEIEERYRVVMGGEWEIEKRVLEGIKRGQSEGYKMIEAARVQRGIVRRAS